MANVFVYLWKPKFQIPQPIARDNSKPFVLIANGEKFWPHAALVRVGRPLVVENTHEEHSNIRTEAIKNDPWNYGLPPQQRVKPPAYQRADTFPTQVKSDVHPWMLAYLFALDHPFAAVTDEQGRFTIEGMPPGEHEFRVWQERVGWLEKSLKITIKPDEQAKSELEYAPDRFKLTEADMLAWDKRLINAQRGVPQALEPRPAAQEPKKDEQK